MHNLHSDPSHSSSSFPFCRICGDDIEPPERAALKPLCLFCGEEQAVQERKSWCVSIPYSKGAYQLITNPADLLGTNPKQPRG